MKKRTLTQLWFLACVICLNWYPVSKAQDFEEEFDRFLEEIENDFQSTVSANEEVIRAFTDSINAGYLKMIRSGEEEFQNFLGENWIECDLEEPFLAETNPKPLILPVYKKTNKSGQINAYLRVYRNELYEPISPVLLVPGDSVFRKTSVSISFFGNKLLFTYDVSLKTILRDEPNNSSVGEIWNLLCKANYSHLLQQLQEVRNTMGLNDWAYYLLIKEIAEGIHEDNNNNSILLTWFLLLKSSYWVKLAYDEDRIVLLLPFKQKVFGIRKMQLGNQTYYTFDYSGEKLYTYPNDYAGAYNIMDISIRYPMRFREKGELRTIKFNYDKQYTLECSVDVSYIDFYRTYPQTELQVYFEAPFSQLARETLIEQITPLISGWPLSKQVEFLLRFVQEGFEYQTDLNQFGREKIFFADDMLFYSYSDCEDRAIFFGKLVHELLGKEIILLDFPGHVVAAIEIPDYHGGYTVEYEGKQWIICDPSYIGAPVGEVIPQYIGQPANISAFGKTAVDTDEEKFCEEIEARRNSIDYNIQQIIRDKGGNSYFMVSRGGSENYLTILHKFDSTCSPVWSKTITGLNTIYDQNLAIDKANNIYMAGTFSHFLSTGNFYLSSNDPFPGYYLMKIGPDGDIHWLTEVPVKKIVSSDDMYFTAMVSNAGTVKYLNTDVQNDCRRDFQLSTDNQGNCYIQGLYLQKRLLQADSIEYMEGRYYDIVSEFLKEYRATEKSASDTLVAFCWTLFNILRRDGIIINCNQLAGFINGIGEPGTISKIFSDEQLKNVLFIRNSNGIIQLTTQNNISVYLQDIIIENDARCRAVFLSDRLKIEIIDGFYKGNQYHRDTINYIDIMKSENRILMEYSNHYNKKLVMKTDIL